MVNKVAHWLQVAHRHFKYIGISELRIPAFITDEVMTYDKCKHSELY